MVIIDSGAVHLELNAIPAWLHTRSMKERLIAFNG
jgi:hypothetical protein